MKIPNTEYQARKSRTEFIPFSRPVRYPGERKRNKFRSTLSAIAATLLLSGALPQVSTAAEGDLHQVGAAAVDITPDYPVRLSGYGSRRTAFDSVEQRIWAKALAIGDDKAPAILLTVDNCGISATMRAAVLKRLQAKVQISNERFAIASSHTHSAPMIDGVLPNLFSTDIPAEHQASIRRYTADLTDRLVDVSLNALKNRKPAKLDWGIGEAGFGANRRTKGGPSDHDLPALRVTSPKGKLRAALVSYACHCTTLGGAFNRVCGDWAGYAQDEFQKDNPGVVFMVAIGCGADQNPILRNAPNDGLDYAKQHGKEISAKTKALFASGKLTPLTSALDCKTADTTLEFLPRTRAEWETRAKNARANISYHAKKNLARLDRGETLQASLPYMVQSWSFGDELAMVFLPGEVVVDYSLRLKREFDPRRIWVNAYANDVPCYIPSERILREGGYEGESSMVYYDRPNKFRPGLEEKIVAAVRQTVPKEFANPKLKAEMIPPTPAAESAALLQTKPGFHVELVASEPLIVDPVAIDFGIDGKLWVVEMHDYPSGLDGNWKPGGRVKFLNDLDGDGRYDKSTLFLDGLPFPTDVMAWKKGALVCAAPDILYAEDTDGDGKADRVDKLFSGFITDNYQARVNGISWGLDNWIYGANGLRGGVISSKSGGRTVDLRSKDFRMKPDLGLFEIASGYTQQGRARDDWGNWFGCNNSSSLFQFPLPERYANRNPHVALPSDRFYVPADKEPERIYPASELLQRFNRPEHANRITGGCGATIYRDSLLGADYYGDAFICAPVHNLVRRLELHPEGPVFRGRRAPDEQRSEFLASKDNWFRPVQAMTGPDGALWVVDMYRFVIEHPRWIPKERLAKLDPRAGSDMGRIYRIYPRGKRLINHSDLSSLSSADLAKKLNTGNGVLRDAIHQELVSRKDRSATKPLEQLSRDSKIPQARMQALCTLDGLRSLTDEALARALSDPHPGVRKQAVRLSEPRLADKPILATKMTQMTDDPDPAVRFQLALSLGNWRDRKAGEALARILARDLGDSWIRAAILSSAVTQPEIILRGAFDAKADDANRGTAVGQLIATAAAVAKKDTFGELLANLAPANDEAENLEPWRWRATVVMQDTLDRRGLKITDFVNSSNPSIKTAAARLKSLYARAHTIAPDARQNASLREAAIRLHGRGFNNFDNDLPLLASLLDQTDSSKLHQAAIDMITRRSSPDIPMILLKNWPRQTPALRTAIVGKLIARQPWILALLDAVEAGLVSPTDIDPVTRLRLSRKEDATIKARVEKLLPLRQSADRRAVIARYKSVASLTGNPTTGAEVFAKNCASCHRLNGQGTVVGPDLAVYRNKGVADFLEAILDPNAIVEPRFTNYSVETKDDRSLTGLIHSESSSGITLIMTQGVKETVRRDDILEIRASTISLMPEGVEQAIPPQAMADLIAFLKSGPIAAK
jgi:putative membrane-bound dehydrogenase-like protein